MKKTILSLSAALLCVTAYAQVHHFSFSGPKTGATVITQADTFNTQRGYGYDFIKVPGNKGGEPFIFSVNVPDGNYKVTVTLGSKKSCSYQFR